MTAQPAPQLPERLLSRRLFLADLGRGAVAIAILGVAACAPNQTSPSIPSTAPSAGASPPDGSSPIGSSPTGSSGPSPTEGGSATAGAGSSGGPGAPGGVVWNRVNLGFVSAYLLVRDGEGTIVDTGVAGSEPQIEAAMRAAGLEWTDVSNVILTHKHPDHAGSIDAILAANPEMAGWIGAPDLAAVKASRALQPLSDGDEVFGLQIVATPGHTVGHISVFDAVGGLLVAGDALRTDGGALSGSNPQFTEDAAAAKATVVKLGKLTFETLLVGHGEPILTGASAQVAALGG